MAQRKRKKKQMCHPDRIITHWGGYANKKNSPSAFSRDFFFFLNVFTFFEYEPDTLLSIVVIFSVSSFLQMYP